MLAKWFPEGNIAFLYLWIWGGLFLAYTALFARWRGKRAFLSFLLVLCLGSLADAFLFYPAYLSKALAGISPSLSSFSQGIAELVTRGSERFLVNWDSVSEHTFNSAVPALLILCACVGIRLPKCCWLFFCALLVPINPLCAVGVIPLLFFAYTSKGSMKPYPLAVSAATALCALPLVICSAFYFISGDGSATRCLWTPSPYYYPVDQDLMGRWGRYGYMLLLLLVPVFIFLFRYYKKTSLLWCALFLALITPLVWLGEENNEFVYKCSVIINFCLAILYASCFVHRRRRTAKAALLLFMFLGAAGSICDIGARVIAHYGWSEATVKENIRDKALGDMENPVSKLYRHFHGNVKAPTLLYDHPGEASEGPLRFLPTGGHSKVPPMMD